MAASSASRRGCWKGTTMMAVPIFIRRVRSATEAAKIMGLPSIP